MITTSRQASPRTRSLASSLAILLHARKISRGKRSLKQISEENAGSAKVLILVERYGNPAGILDLSDGRMYPFSGVHISKGTRKILGDLRPSRVVSGEKVPSDQRAIGIRSLLLSVPAYQGSLVTKLEVLQRPDSEVLVLSSKGIEFVKFFFR